MTGPTAPRAEFRVFGPNVIRQVEPCLWNGRTVLGQQRTMPAETYILSRFTNDANVKVRDGLLDIKVKIGETPEGYEIFEPRGKFQFQADHAALATILQAPQIAVPEPRPGWTFEAFRQLEHEHRDLVAVTVEKVRHGLTIDGVICEYAMVWFNGALVESAGVESDGYDAMRAVVDTLGLSGQPNVNYLKAAKRVVGLA